MSTLTQCVINWFLLITIIVFACHWGHLKLHSDISMKRWCFWKRYGWNYKHLVRFAWRFCLVCKLCLMSGEKRAWKKTSIKVSSLLYTSSSISLLLWNCLRAFTLNSIQITDAEHLALFSVAHWPGARKRRATMTHLKWSTRTEWEKELSECNADRSTDGWIDGLMMWNWDAGENAERAELVTDSRGAHVFILFEKPSLSLLKV